MFDFNVIMQVFSSLKKSEFLSFSWIIFKIASKTYKKTAKAQNYCWIYQASYWTAYIESYGLRIKSKKYQYLDKKLAKTTLNFDPFYQRLLRLSAVKKISIDWSGIKFPLLRTTPSIIKSIVIQNPSHRTTLKHQFLSWNTLYDQFHCASNKKTNRAFVTSKGLG